MKIPGFIEDLQAKTKSYFASTKNVSISKDLIEKIEEELKTSNDSSIRLCLHKSPDENYHQMIIGHSKSHYYRPHKHLEKPESYHIIKGKLLCIIFDQEER